MMRPGSGPPSAQKRVATSPGGEHDDRATIWAFVWTLFAFKMATVVLMLYHMRAWESDLVIAATTWYWFPALAGLLAAPIAFHLRLRKMRARRRELMRAEWMVNGDDELAVSRRGGTAAER